MFFLIIGLCLITTVFILIFVLQKVGEKWPKLQKKVLWLLPKGIILVAIIYMIISYYELYIFLNQGAVTIETFKTLFIHDKTYVSMVNFFALLTFYQFLEDRYKKIYAKPFNKLSVIEVITKDVHNQILKQECEKVAKEYRMKIREIKKQKSNNS
ncbi:hypothetical protein [Sporosarcina sp. OR05]|uniref:hypothetical protein n=1 Tax=Sporosarcina sp. OR05 TaxID=2969819 RepID=UPI00352AE038